jgi:threonine synthase
VPSGNFGNICAGLLAHVSGIPVKNFVAACNANDVIPNYFETGKFEEKPAVATISNAMDVANPSNFVRILELFDRRLDEAKKMIASFSTNDAKTKETIRKVYKEQQYILDPHSAVAYHALEKYLQNWSGEKGIFIATAHPIKFPEIVEREIRHTIGYPETIRQLMHRPSLKTKMKADYNNLKEFLREEL